jgi:hypothetical protein
MALKCDLLTLDIRVILKSLVHILLRVLKLDWDFGQTQPELAVELK